MKSKSLPFLTAALFALSTASFADEFDDFDSDDNSSAQVACSGDNCNSYDASTDSEFANDEDYAEAYARYKTQHTSKEEINRARTEGFSRSIDLGVKIQGGINTFLGENSDGWGLGFQGGAGMTLQLPLGIKNLSVASELTFNYRHYSYEMDTDFGTNDASIDIMLFEIPIIFRYTMEDLNLFLGVGINLGLSLTSTSEFNEIGESKSRDNTIKTTGVEVGGAFDLGYILTRSVHVNIRVVPCFTSLLNKTLNAEKTFNDSSLNTFYTTLGLTFLF